MSQLDGLSALPTTVLLLLVVNIGAHALIFITSFNAGHLAISADRVIHGDLYRLVSAAFTHGGLLHIFMNMSSLYSLGPLLEQQFGSLSFLLMTLWAAVLGNIIYCLISAFFWLVTGDYNAMRVSGVGFSGVLFTYACIDSYHTTQTTRSVFGCFNVPAKVYPWVLLVLISVVLPNISFTGHLSGMLFGVFLMSGGDTLVLPSPQYLEALDQSYFFSAMYRHSGFVRTTGKSYSVREAVLGEPSPSFIGTACSRVFVWTSNICETVMYMFNCPSPSRMRGVLAQLWTTYLTGPWQRYFGTDTTYEHGSDVEEEIRPPLPLRVQRAFTSARDSDGLGSYAPVGAEDSEGGKREEPKSAII